MSIFLISNKDKKIEISKSACNQSHLLKKIIENDEKVDHINIQYVDEDILEKIIEYMNWHDKNKNKFSKLPKPLYSNNWENYIKQDRLQRWDYDFINSIKINDDLIRLVKAANYLEINSLFELLCAKIAQICNTYVEEPKKLCEILGNTWWKDENKDENKDEKNTL